MWHKKYAEMNEIIILQFKHKHCSVHVLLVKFLSLNPNEFRFNLLYYLLVYFR